MPALNFKKQFAGFVELGLKQPDHPDAKRQTIRALRKDCRNPQEGQTLYLYTGQRTKSCRKLGETVCKSVEQICINYSYFISLGSRDLTITEESELIRQDGFDNSDKFFEFFLKTHGLPFYGLLIKW